jgi:hypothetical protein
MTTILMAKQQNKLIAKKGGKQNKKSSGISTAFLLLIFFFYLIGISNKRWNIAPYSLSINGESFDSIISSTSLVPKLTRA